jgi:putative transposase
MGKVGGPRSITFSCRHRLPLLGSPKIRDAFAEELAAAVARHPHRLAAWVAMPEHVHLVVAPPMESREVESFLWDFKRALARRVVGRWRNLGAPILHRITDSSGKARFWQPGGGWDRAIRDLDRLRDTIEYIHANPVRRGLVERAEQWRWSSYGAWHTDETPIVPVETQW